MNRYGIADVGSNTVVLIIYETDGNVLRQLKYISTPVHLINYVHDHHMSRQGIETAAGVLREYARILDEAGVVHRFADLTEPGRVDNREELVKALAESGFEIHALSGQQEAVYDYEGAKLFYPDIHEGIAFDVGGGSTELISFENDQAVETVSLPLGCVRLAKLPLDTKECALALQNARENFPSFANSAKEIIGIGGTARAVGLLCEKAYGDRHRVRAGDLREIFEKIRTEDEQMCALMRATVDPARVPVFLPGIHMILEICAMFETQTILISDTGIREGFLLDCIRKL